MRHSIHFITMLVILVCLSLCSVLAQKKDNSSDLSIGELKALEDRAEAGDTAAMHRLIRFYADNSAEYIEVVEAVDADGNPIEIDNPPAGNSDKADLSDLYKTRLEYWLDKGISRNDPVAYAVRGYQLYYTDEKNAIKYLAKAADMGIADAALFCGSACFNQGKYEDAFKYLTDAYNQGVPSAGWHLALCYANGYGTQISRNKAIECMRQAANLDYPEAVLEMRRIEPENPVWVQKVDSLEIDFPCFPIIN